VAKRRFSAVFPSWDRPLRLEPFHEQFFLGFPVSLHELYPPIHPSAPCPMSPPPPSPLPPTYALQPLPYCFPPLPSSSDPTHTTPSRIYLPPRVPFTLLYPYPSSPDLPCSPRPPSLLVPHPPRIPLLAASAFRQFFLSSNSYLFTHTSSPSLFFPRRKSSPFHPPVLGLPILIFSLPLCHPLARLTSSSAISLSSFAIPPNFPRSH